MYASMQTQTTDVDGMTRWQLLVLIKAAGLRVGDDTVEMVGLYLFTAAAIAPLVAAQSPNLYV